MGKEFEGENGKSEFVLSVQTELIPEVKSGNSFFYNEIDFSIERLFPDSTSDTQS